MMTNSVPNDKKNAFSVCQEGRFADVVAFIAASEESELGAVNGEFVACIVQALVESGQVENAARYYLKYLGSGLPLPMPWTVSTALRQKKSADLDVVCWKEWSERFPDRPQGWIEFARSLERAGRQAEVPDLLRKASSRFPKNANIYAQLGMSCLREGEREESQAAFKIALSIDPLQPAWVKRAVSALHREVVELHGVVLSVPVRVVSPLVLSHLVKGNYEGRELSLLQQCLKSDDRILELGAGLGFLACFVGRAHPDIPYIAIEANPQLIPVIRENFKLNNCGIQLLHGAAAVTNDTILFHVADDFWASSIENIAHLHTDMEVPGIDIQPIMEDLKPTLLIIDIEGGELNLVPQLNLTCVDRLLIELHPDIYGNEGSNRIIKSLLDQKFYLDVQNSGTQVFLFVRS